MTTEKLKTLIAELLEVSDSEKNLAFFLFKKKITENLQLGEAIKIPTVGVFQLKEQFNVTKEKSASSKGKKAIIFSPTEENDEESLFLTLELDENDDSLEFDEKVFSIGIDKPILPIGENDRKEESEQLSLERKITDVISKSEKIENFDLWDDYLDKHAASVLPGETEELNDIDSYLQSEEIGPSEDDFMEFDEDELLSEFENTEIEYEEILSITDEEEPTDVVADTDIDTDADFITEENEPLIELPNKDIEPANEILEDLPVESEEIISNVDEIEEVISLDEEESTRKLDESIFYEAEETDEKIGNTEDIKQVDNTENEESQKEVLPILEEEETIKNKSGKKMGLKKKNVMHERRYSPTIYALIAAFFIVGGIGIYYLFFNNPTWLYDQNEIEIELSEKHQREFEEAKRKARLLAQKEDSIKIAKAKEKIANEKNAMNTKGTESVDTGTKTVAEESNKKITNEVKTETKKTIAAPPKKEITKVQEEVLNKTNTLPKKKYNKRKAKISNMPKNVYFNGSSYSLQTSSWPQKYLAEKEVNRLKQKGYDAFIIKAYIPKFKKNWYRVRIGNLSTIEEAKQVQQQIK